MLLLLLAEPLTLMWSFTFLPLALSFAMRTASLRSCELFAVPLSSMLPFELVLTVTPERFEFCCRAD